MSSIPTTGSQSGSNLLAIMHTHHFVSAEQLAAYLGLVPVERQSGSSLLGRRSPIQSWASAPSSRAVYGNSGRHTIQPIS
ncbi:transposase [Chromobacterium violaceum]|uniref:transposase n=1 Tax=Chromobacterium violaceum TaxID=536 RepID=UPI003CC8345D